MPWKGFYDLRQEILSKVFSNFPEGRRKFPSRAGLSDRGDCVARKRVADEKCLEFVEHLSVEDPVRVIIDELRDNSATKAVFNIGSGVIFQNHPNALSDLEEKTAAQQRVTREQPAREQPARKQSAQSQSSGSAKKPKINPDQICVYLFNGNNKRLMAYVVKYKAPHKLTVEHLRKGLRPRINIYDEVINKVTMPARKANDAEKFQYHAERITAAALTQTYHYMIEGGLEYGYVMNGMAFVFLNINWSDPGTLYYFFADPGSDVEKGDAVHYSAVSNVLVFTFLAFSALISSHVHNQDERYWVSSKLHKWAVSFYAILRGMEENEEKDEEESKKEAISFEDYEPSKHSSSEDGSPPRKKLRSTCRPEKDLENVKRQSPSSSETLGDDNSDGGGGGSSNCSVNPFASEPSKAAEKQDNREGHDQYCSQKCLLGLLRGEQIDNC